MAKTQRWDSWGEFRGPVRWRTRDGRNQGEGSGREDWGEDTREGLGRVSQGKTQGKDSWGEFRGRVRWRTQDGRNQGEASEKEDWGGDTREGLGGVGAKTQG